MAADEVVPTLAEPDADASATCTVIFDQSSYEVSFSVDFEDLSSPPNEIGLYLPAQRGEAVNQEPQVCHRLLPHVLVQYGLCFYPCLLSLSWCSPHDMSHQRCTNTTICSKIQPLHGHMCVWQYSISILKLLRAWRTDRNACRTQPPLCTSNTKSWNGPALKNQSEEYTRISGFYVLLHSYMTTYCTCMWIVARFWLWKQKGIWPFYGVLKSEGKKGFDHFTVFWNPRSYFKIQSFACILLQHQGISLKFGNCWINSPSNLSVHNDFLFCWFERKPISQASFLCRDYDSVHLRKFWLAFLLRSSIRKSSYLGESVNHRFTRLVYWFYEYCSSRSQIFLMLHRVRFSQTTRIMSSLIESIQHSAICYSMDCGTYSWSWRNFGASIIPWPAGCGAVRNALAKFTNS